MNGPKKLECLFLSGLPMFVDKTEAYPIEPPLFALPTNIRLEKPEKPARNKQSSLLGSFLRYQ